MKYSVNHCNHIENVFKLCAHNMCDPTKNENYYFLALEAVTKISANYLFQSYVLARYKIHTSNEEWNQVLNHFGQRDTINQYIGKGNWLYQKGNAAMHRRSHK